MQLNDIITVSGIVLDAYTITDTNPILPIPIKVSGIGASPINYML